jgi:hypothetical protein
MRTFEDLTDVWPEIIDQSRYFWREGKDHDGESAFYIADEIGQTELDRCDIPRHVVALEGRL